MQQSLFFQIIQGLAIPFCCFCAWTLMALLLWSLCSTVKSGVLQVARLHQIPCASCAFFTGDYRLKCTVHPSKALSEEAISCIDYEPITSWPK